MRKKKWILQAEVTKILKMYSIRSDEFEPVSKTEYSYKSKYVKDYVITLSEELINGIGVYGETGRIIVSHSQSNGKRTFQDIWERDKDNNLQFRFRNLWNQPFSDADYIKDLEEQNNQLRQIGRKLQEQLEAEKQNHGISREKNTEYQEYQKLNTDNEILPVLLEKATQEKRNLQEQIHILKEEYQKLKTETAQNIEELTNIKKHNARGAGRKPSKERLNAIEQVRTLLDNGFSDQEIQKKLSISKATFYRYKRSIRN